MCVCVCVCLSVSCNLVCTVSKKTDKAGTRAEQTLFFFLLFLKFFIPLSLKNIPHLPTHFKLFVNIYTNILFSVPSPPKQGGHRRLVFPVCWLEGSCRLWYYELSININETCTEPHVYITSRRQSALIDSSSWSSDPHTNYSLISVADFAVVADHAKKLTITNKHLSNDNRISSLAAMICKEFYSFYSIFTLNKLNPINKNTYWEVEGPEQRGSQKSWLLTQAQPQAQKGYTSGGTPNCTWGKNHWQHPLDR